MKAKSEGCGLEDSLNPRLVSFSKIFHSLAVTGKARMSLDMTTTPRRKKRYRGPRRNKRRRMRVLDVILCFLANVEATCAKPP